MPISVRWDDGEKTTLYYTVTAKWSLEEAWYILQHDVIEMLEDVNYVTDVIIHFQESQSIPSGVLNFWRRAYNWMQKYVHPTVFVAVVQAPPIIRGIGDSLRTLRTPIMRYVVFVDSVEEAHQKITGHRAKTPRIHFD